MSGMSDSLTRCVWSTKNEFQRRLKNFKLEIRRYLLHYWSTRNLKLWIGHSPLQQGHLKLLDSPFKTKRKSKIRPQLTLNGNIDIKEI